MATIDYIVLVAYLMGTLAVGFYYYSRNRSSQDMFAAGGTSPWWVSGLSGFMTLKSAGTFVVWGGLAYREGVVAIAIVTCIGISGILVGLFVAGRWREIGVTTPAEFIDFRFGPGAVQFYTWTMMAVRTFSAGVALYAVAVMLVSLVPLAPGNPFRDAVTGNLSIEATILLFGAIIIVYTVSGGLWAVLMTDVLQFIVLKLAVIFIIPLLLLRLYDGSPIASVPPSFFVPVTEQYTFLFLAGWVAIHFFVVGAEWAFAQRYICVPSIADARKSAILFGALYLISPTIWLTPTIIYRMIDPVANPEAAYILASKLVLPVGMLGLMMAAMFSAAASSISGQLNVFAGVLSEQFYRKLFNPSAADTRMVWVGRLFTLLIGLATILVAVLVPRLGGAEKIVLTLTGFLLGPLMAPSVFGLLSGRIGRSAVFTTAIVSIAVGSFFKLAAPSIPGIAELWIAGWVQANARMSDILFGAVLPTVILVVAHFRSRHAAPGWPELKRRTAAYQPTPPSTVAGDHSPSVVTWISLAATGGVMLALVPFNDAGRTPLILFAACLLALAGVIWWFSRRRATASAQLPDVARGAA